MIVLLWARSFCSQRDCAEFDKISAGLTTGVGDNAGRHDKKSVQDSPNSHQCDRAHFVRIWKASVMNPRSDEHYKFKPRQKTTEKS